MLCLTPPDSQTAPSVQKPAAAALSAGHSVHPAQGESSQCSDLSGYKRPPSPLSATQQSSEPPLLPHSFLPSDPGRWNIEDVYEFISSLPGGRCRRLTFVHAQTLCRFLLEASDGEMKDERDNGPCRTRT